MTALHKVAPWLVLGLLALPAVPAGAEESDPRPACLTFIFNQLGEGFGLYTALNNAIGLSLTYGDVDQGVTLGAIIHPSACQVDGGRVPASPPTQEAPHAPSTRDPIPLLP